MTREDINDIINAICPNDEDYEKPCISPKYLRQELEQLALDQRQWNGEPTTKNNLGVDCISRHLAIERMKKVVKDIEKLEGSEYITIDRLKERLLEDSITILRALPPVTPQELKPMVEIDLDYVIKQKYIEREILDKIRAEIKKWYWQADKQALAKDPCVVDAMIDLFIRTIDKYKTEVEPQESEDV